MKETEKSKLLSQFEILEGITSDMFDDKDWTKFDRFCERQYIEHKGTVLTTEEVMKGRSSACDFNDIVNDKFWELIDMKAESDNIIDLDAYSKGVRDGVKWQQERSYSEEENTAKYIDRHLVQALVESVKEKLYTKEDMLEAFNAGNKRGHSGYPDTDNWTQPTFEYFISRKKEDKTEIL